MSVTSSSLCAKSKYVYGRKGTKFENVAAIITGGKHCCQMEGCTGNRIAVRWPDGKHTFPCTKGMKIREDGQWEIM